MYMILQKCSLWKVAEVFFVEPTKIHFIKEISRKINLAHTSVKNHLKNLIELGLIIPVMSEIYPGYKSNRENPDFIFYKKLNNIIQLRESGLTEFLKEKYPKSIILFGSYDKGEDIEESDIDIFLDTKKFSIPKINKFEKTLNRKLHILFKEDISNSLKESINQGTILFGERR